MSRQPQFQIEVRHDGLNKYRVIKGSDRVVVRQKALMQQLQWEEMWQRKQEADQRRAEKAKAAADRQGMRDLAEERTLEAKTAIDTLQGLLVQSLSVRGTTGWNDLIQHDDFKESKPPKPSQRDIEYRNEIRRPERSNAKYRPRYGILGRILPPVRRARYLAVETSYQHDYGEWEQAEREANVRFESALAQYKKASMKFDQRKSSFYERQRKYNETIQLKEKEYLDKQPGAVIDFVEMILSRSRYPDYFLREFDIDFEPESGHLIVDYSLPSLDDLPKIKEVRYVQTRNELTEILLKEKELNSLYDDVIYQIALRTIHELFDADSVGAISTVSFNGYVTSMDKATGHDTTKCILSLQAGKQEFSSISLENVDPRACFKSLKGISSSKLHSMTPIAPIVTISKEDRRFIDSYEVADGLDDSVNIAAMDWEDFEHLIRELFEEEFSEENGEVKVTRASRDGGVDAVAFDPDPIRGGKIVIQAKRYTNTVGVSAVRDLYGTVLNEGATKGILVSTADYGPDAYAFAKDKPLTLLNGSNLLHLLEKHGHRAKIDIQAAKLQLAQTTT